MLSTLLLLPLIGALLMIPLPRHSALVRGLAMLTATVTLVWAGLLGRHFDSGQGQIQLFETHVWHERFGSAFALGIDGIAYLMVLLAALLAWIAVLASLNAGRSKGYYLLLLLLESAMLGVFTARDWSLFYVFWELTLIPLFFLIDRWGGENRARAAINFVLYTMGGSVFMLIALLVLFDHNPAHNFDMTAIAEAARSLPQGVQTILFLALLIGFGVKMPVFPLHGWLPLAHVEAPSPVSILLSGILLKMGAYGLLRTVEMLPGAALALQPLLAGLALWSLFYGGILAWKQRDLKAMIAYSSISHMGVVLLGIATLNGHGLTGAALQMLAHGLVAGSLFLLIGLLYERTHTRDIADYSSLVKVMPRFALFTVLAFIGAVGMPGSASFVAELHALVGGLQRFGFWVVIISLGVVISAAYAMRTVGRLFTGPVRPAMQQIPDLSRGELFAALVLTIGSFGLGIRPDWVTPAITSSLTRLLPFFPGS